MRHNNLLPVLIEMFSEFRSTEFRENMRYIQDDLWRDYPPQDAAVSDLPHSVRNRVGQVTSFFNTVGVPVANDVIDELIPSSYMGGSILRMWSRFSPYVHNERTRRDDENYYIFFENLAYVAHLSPPRVLSRRLALKRMPKNWRFDRPDLMVKEEAGQPAEARTSRVDGEGAQ